MSDQYALAYLSIDELQELPARQSATILGFKNGEVYKTPYSRFENTVVVKSASDLENIDSTKSYMIDGVVDMGSTSIEVPEGGISLSGLNGARDVTALLNGYVVLSERAS